MKKKKRYLDQEEVTEYAQLCARIKKLAERKDKARMALVEKMTDGYRCPRKGPYLLILSFDERKDWSWKEEFKLMARRVWGKSWRRKLKKLRDQATTERIPVLEPKVNPDYEDK